MRRFMICFMVSFFTSLFVTNYWIKYIEAVDGSVNAIVIFFGTAIGLALYLFALTHIKLDPDEDHWKGALVVVLYTFAVLPIAFVGKNKYESIKTYSSAEIKMVQSIKKQIEKQENEIHITILFQGNEGKYTQEDAFVILDNIVFMLESKSKSYKQYEGVLYSLYKYNANKSKDPSRGNSCGI